MNSKDTTPNEKAMGMPENITTKVTAVNNKPMLSADMSVHSLDGRGLVAAPPNLDQQLQ